MAFVAVVLGLLGALMIGGLVMLYLKLDALAGELRAARAAGAHQLATQLDAIADKQQGTRFDLDRMTNALQAQGRRIDALTFQLEGPPSVRRPQVAGATPQPPQR